MKAISTSNYLWFDLGNIELVKRIVVRSILMYSIANYIRFSIWMSFKGRLVIDYTCFATWFTIRHPVLFDKSSVLQSLNIPWQRRTFLNFFLDMEHGSEGLTPQFALIRHASESFRIFKELLQSSVMSDIHFRNFRRCFTFRKLWSD